MRSFSKLYSDFWINYDNSEVLGTGVDGQLMALYLQSNTHYNMLGAYYLPLLYISSDLKLSVKKVQTALKKLCEINYCKYDTKTQYIWVCNLVHEQIGKKIDVNDNRIKALQEIWKSLPLQLEFLEDIYNKYYYAFHLESRDFKKHHVACEIKSKDAAVSTNIPSSTECVPPFEGTSKPLSNFLEDKSIDIASNKNLPEAPLAVSNISTKSSSDVSDTAILVQDSLNYAKSEVSATALISSEELQTCFEHPYVPLRSPSEGSSNPLQSPSEAPLEPLRSNIEEINKKKEIEKDLKKTEEKKKTNNALNSNSVAQMQPYFEKPPEIFNFSFLKTTEDLEETKKTGAVDAKKQLIANKIHNLPVVTIASELKTNPVPVFSVSSSVPVVLTACNNAVAPIVYNGSVISISHAIVIIFEHWKKVMGYPEAELDYDRKNWINRALKRNSIEKLCEAITGCFLTPFNMGDNEQGERYNDLHVIFKNNAQIERFVRNSHHPPKKETKAQKWSRENLGVAKEWAKGKTNKLTENSFFGSNYV